MPRTVPVSDIPLSPRPSPGLAPCSFLSSFLGRDLSENDRHRLAEAMILGPIKRGVNQFWASDPHACLKFATFKDAKRSRARISDFQLHARNHSVQFGGTHTTRV